MDIGNIDIKKIKQGEQVAFKTLVDLYSSSLFRYAIGFVRTKEIAEEVVSDVFLDVWLSREKLSEVRNIKAWLFTLTHNKAISYCRKTKGNNDTISIEDVIDYQIGYILPPDYQIISKEEIIKINKIIAMLPPKCKMVFTLAKIEQLPYKEIAEILNISVKTINIHIAKALEIISKALKKESGYR